MDLIKLCKKTRTITFYIYMHIEVQNIFVHNIETNYKKEKQLGIAFIKQVTNAKDY